MKRLNEFLNESSSGYNETQLINFITDMADEQSNWGTTELDKEEVEFSVEIVTDGDDSLVDSIIELVKSVKDKKGAQKWLIDSIMSSEGSSNRKEFLRRLKKTI